MITVFNHPLHAMLIHSPSALLPMAMVCYAFYYLTRDTSFAFAPFYAFAGAAITRWLSILFETVNICSIAPANGEAIRNALSHGVINVPVIIYTVMAYSVYKRFPQLPVASITALATKAFLVNLYGDWESDKWQFDFKT